LQSQAAYKDVYGLYTGRQGADSKQAWLNASPSSRFFFYQMLDGTIGSAPVGSKGLSFLKLRQLLHTNDFKNYLQTIVGQELGQATPIKVHRMQPQHFLKKHDDRNGNRRIAFILYLSPVWQVEFGGQLELVDRQNRAHSVAPNFNRLLVFDVTNHKHHYIKRFVNPIPSSQVNRLSINGWFLNL
jgi:Rps23 Pro-64 3,4-dihydroxylase Tpa1-like proline 4-hydroxylase